MHRIPSSIVAVSARRMAGLLQVRYLSNCAKNNILSSVSRKFTANDVFTTTTTQSTKTITQFTRFYASQAKEITLPALSPTMEEGVIVEWLKKEGEEYKTGDVLFRLQTDKSVLDVEAQDDGVLAKIIVQANAPAQPVNSTVAFIADPGTDVSKLQFPDVQAKKLKKEEVSKENTVKATPPSSIPSEKSKTATSTQPSSPSPSPSSSKPSESPATTSGTTTPTTTSSSTSSTSDVFLFPSVRRILAENNMDVAKVKGTGPGGRITKGDVLASLASGNKNSSPPSAQQRAPTPSSSSSSSSAPSPSSPASKQQTPSTTTSYEDIPNNNIRLVIAKRLTESKTQIPHMYVTAECNIDQLLELRARLNAAQTVKLSVNDFILKAAAMTLRAVPKANAAWGKDGVQLLKNVDVSVAVATEKGLLTPIIPNTDQKGIASIATELKDLAGRARAGKLKPHEFQGGSFSVSNLGMYGISQFIAVINPPQSAILAVGTGRKEVQFSTSSKVNLDEDNTSSTNQPEPKVVNVMDVTLSCDSRVIDEALARQFLQKFQEFMGNPERLLL